MNLWRRLMSDKKNAQIDDEISMIFNNPQIITQAIQAGIHAALLKHKQLGLPICVWRDDKVIWIDP